MEGNSWAAVIIVALNVLGSVLTLWIRARYNYHEGNGNGNRPKT